MKEKILKEIEDKVSNINDIRKKRLITSILKNPSWYYIEDFDFVCNILSDLGYSKEQIKKIYITLVSN